MTELDLENKDIIECNKDIVEFEKLVDKYSKEDLHKKSFKYSLATKEEKNNVDI